MGVEQDANLRHAVGDLRYYMDNDLQFLGAVPMTVTTADPRRGALPPTPVSGSGHAGEVASS